jgi:hypothetical protein
MSAAATPADERIDLLAAVQRATNSVLCVVLFAAAFGVIRFVGTIGWIASFRISFAI